MTGPSASVTMHAAADAIAALLSFHERPACARGGGTVAGTRGYRPEGRAPVPDRRSAHSLASIDESPERLNRSSPAHHMLSESLGLHQSRKLLARSSYLHARFA